MALDLYFFLNAVGYFFEVEFEFDAQVRAFAYSSLLATAATAKEAPKWTAFAKNVTKLRENVIHAHATATIITTASSTA